MLRNLALKKPDKPIQVPEGLDEFGSIKYNVTNCIRCKKCEKICPEKAIEFIRELYEDKRFFIETVQAKRAISSSVTSPLPSGSQLIALFA